MAPRRGAAPVRPAALGWPARWLAPARGLCRCWPAPSLGRAVSRVRGPVSSLCQVAARSQFFVRGRPSPRVWRASRCWRCRCGGTRTRRCGGQVPPGPRVSRPAARPSCQAWPVAPARLVACGPADYRGGTGGCSQPVPGCTAGLPSSRRPALARGHQAAKRLTRARDPCGGLPGPFRVHGFARRLSAAGAVPFSGRPRLAPRCFARSLLLCSPWRPPASF